MRFSVCLTELPGHRVSDIWPVGYGVLPRRVGSQLPAGALVHHRHACTVGLSAVLSARFSISIYLSISGPSAGPGLTCWCPPNKCWVGIFHTRVCNSSGNCTQTLYTRVFTRGFWSFTSEVDAPTELHPTFTTVCSPSAQLVHHQHSLFTTGCSPKAFVHQRRLFTRFSESNCNTGVIRHIGSLVSSVKEGGAGGTVGGRLVS